MNNLIKVKVFPASKRGQVIRKLDDTFEIRVKEKPKNGEANRAVTAALAAYLNIPQSRLKLIKGSTQRNKIFEVI